MAWHKQDQLLLSWLLSSLTESVHAQVVGLDTLLAVWQYLTSAFASQSQARITQLCLSLHSLKKGADPMATYLLKAKSISDKLALACRPISDEDMILYILGGLSSEYSAFVISVTTRNTPLSVADLHGLLLNKEIHCQNSMSDLINATANMAPNSRTSDNRNQQRGRSRGYGGSRGRGRQSYSSSQYQHQSDHNYSNQHSGQNANRGPSFCNQCHHSSTPFNEAYHMNQPYYPNQAPSVSSLNGTLILVERTTSHQTYSIFCNAVYFVKVFF
ncbi:UBN2 domain-containing protein [Cephalotus follicularis]|uniref:UBN2 domain-containing protein n=1 Tax=Cephalotus follicularis TaxID=3775 RepID=A0A1Q3C0A5_CEPFO|nr:UBN2 domain-containing protein [Cephalotus follicularis]